MANIAVIESFNNNLSKTLINVNFGDNMYPKISEKTQQKLIFKFGLEREETVLFYQESGILIKKYSLVLTDKGVYYKDGKQQNAFIWKDVIDIWWEISPGSIPDYVDFHFSTTQGECVIFMCEFGIIKKDEIEYVEPVVNGLKQMVVSAKGSEGRISSNQSRSPFLSKYGK